MAKIKFHKFQSQPIKGEKIDSITRFDDKTKDELLRQKSEMMRRQGITQIKANDIILKQSEEEQGFGM